MMLNVFLTYRFALILNEALTFYSVAFKFCTFNFGADFLGFLICKISFRIFLFMSMPKRVYRIIHMNIPLKREKKFIQNLLLTFFIFLYYLCLKVFLLKVLTPK